MPTKCDNMKSTTNDVTASKEARDLTHENRVATVFKIPDKIIKWIDGLVPDETTEKELKAQIIENFGEESERANYVIPIWAMMNGSEMAYAEAVRHMRGYEVQESDVFHNMITKKDNAEDLWRVPLPTLKTLYQKLRTVAWESLDKATLDKLKDKDKSLAGTGADLNTGLLGKLKVQFLIPSKLAYKEKTGAIYMMQRHINTYGPLIQNFVNRFDHTTKDRPFGMTSIYRRLTSLRMNLIRKHDKETLDAGNLYRLFANILRGRVQYIDGVFKYALKKDTVLDKEGNPRVFDDGTMQFHYQDFVPLSEYTPTKGTKGQWDVELDAAGMEVLQGKKGYKDETGRKLPNLIAQFRQIDEEVFNLTMAMSGKKNLKYKDLNLYQQSVEDVLIPLQETYGLGRKELDALFNRPGSQDGQAVLKIINSDPKMKERHEYLMEVFDGYFNIGGHIEGVDIQPRQMKFHYPSLFTVDTRKRLWENMMTEKQTNQRKKQSLINNYKAKQTDGTLKPAEFVILEKLVKDVKKLADELADHQEVLDNMDNMVEDKLTDTLITPIRHNKYTKELTNAFDDAEARFDPIVYKDYLRHIFGQIHRNKLTATMLTAFNKAESSQVKDIITNIYKLPFNRADIESGVGYFQYGSTAISGYFGKLGLTISPEDVNFWSRVTNNYLTGVFLNRPTSAITNMSAATQNVIDYGWRRTMDGWNAWYENRNEWNELIRKSGIIDFTEYFSTALVEQSLNTKIEEELMEEILAYQMRYWYRLDKGIKPVKALEELELSITEVLEESAMYGLHLNKLGDVMFPKSKERTTKRYKDWKRKKIMNRVNNFSNWAITKDYTMRQTLTKGLRDTKTKQMVAGVKNIMNKSTWGRSLGTNVLKGWGNALKQLNLTMADSEQFVRTLSFVIGVNHAQSKGELPAGNPWDLGDNAWTEDQVQQAIEIGKSYSEWSNFQLSRGGMGSMGYGGLGPLVGKFKIWSHQKWARDFDIISNAYRGMKDDFHIDNDTFDPKAIGKLFKKMFREGQSYEGLRKSDPQVAQLKTYIMTQGLWTFFFDLMVLGPLPVRMIVRNIPGLNSMFGRTLGSGTSDLASFIFMPLILMINFLSGAMDEDEIDKTWTFYFRRTAFGFLPNWGMDLIMGIVGSHGEKDYHRSNVFSPVLPGPGLQGARQRIAPYFYLDFGEDDDKDY